MELNTDYSETEEELVSRLTNLPTDIYCNREFMLYMRNKKTWLNKSDNPEHNLVLMDYERPENKVPRYRVVLLLEVLPVKVPSPLYHQ